MGRMYTYAGRYSAIEIDGIRIRPGGVEELTDEQYERAKRRGVVPADEVRLPTERLREPADPWEKPDVISGDQDVVEEV